MTAGVRKLSPSLQLKLTSDTNSILAASGFRFVSPHLAMPSLLQPRDSLTCLLHQFGVPCCIHLCLWAMSAATHTVCNRVASATQHMLAAQPCCRPTGGAPNQQGHGAAAARLCPCCRPRFKPQWARIIQGDEEGAFGWASVRCRCSESELCVREGQGGGWGVGWGKEARRHIVRCALVRCSALMWPSPAPWPPHPPLGGPTVHNNAFAVVRA